MKYLERTEQINVGLDEYHFKYLLTKKIEYLKGINKLRDISLDSQEVIHCYPSGLTMEKGIHIQATLKFINVKDSKSILVVNYSILPIQKHLILMTVVLNCMFISTLLFLFIFGIITTDSSFFKWLLGLPILLIFTLWLVYISFNQQIVKISTFLHSIEKWRLNSSV